MNLFEKRLTSAEWQILAEYLEGGDLFTEFWAIEGVFDEKYTLLQSAEVKFLEVAKQLKGGEEECMN